MCGVHNGTISRDEFRASLDNLIKREQNHRVEVTHEAIKETKQEVEVKTDYRDKVTREDIQEAKQEAEVKIKA